MSSKSAQVGQFVKIQLHGSGQETLEGHVFAKTEQILVLQQPPTQPPLPHHPPKHTYRLISNHAVKSLSQAKDASPSAAAASMPDILSKKINIDKVRARESNAIRQMQQRLKKIGVGVSKQSQAIFDALSRTLPCEWDKDMIVVFGGDVRIRTPYRVQDVGGSDTGSIEHVKKVVGLISRLYSV